MSFDRFHDLDLELIEGYDLVLRWALGRYYDRLARTMIPSSIAAYGLAIHSASFIGLLLASAFTLGWSMLLVRNERRWSDTEGST